MPPKLPIAVSLCSLYFSEWPSPLILVNYVWFIHYPINTLRVSCIFSSYFYHKVPKPSLGLDIFWQPKRLVYNVIIIGWGNDHYSQSQNIVKCRLHLKSGQKAKKSYKNLLAQVASSPATTARENVTLLLVTVLLGKQKDPWSWGPFHPVTIQNNPSAHCTIGTALRSSMGFTTDGLPQCIQQISHPTSLTEASPWGRVQSLVSSRLPRQLRSRDFRWEGRTKLKR